MSKIVVSSMITINGYTEGRGGNVMAMPMDGRFSEHNADRVRAAGRLLFGGTGYRGMLQYWPGQVGNTEASVHDRYIATRYADGIPITVVSDSLAEADLSVWGDQTTIVRRTDAHDAVRRLRADGDDRDVVIFGSRTLWTDLLGNGLVDELYILIGPKVIAGDHRAFDGLSEIELDLLDVRTWKDSGSVVVHYAARNAE